MNGGTLGLAQEGEGVFHHLLPGYEQVEGINQDFEGSGIGFSLDAGVIEYLQQVV